MDLKTFVAETITQLMEGVKEAQERAKESGGYVNPMLAGAIAKELMQHSLFVAEGGVAQLMEFDVAVSATESAGTKGGIGVVVAAIALGASGQSSAESSATSRGEIPRADHPALEVCQVEAVARSCAFRPPPRRRTRRRWQSSARSGARSSSACCQRRGRAGVALALFSYRARVPYSCDCALAPLRRLHLFLLMFSAPSTYRSHEACASPVGEPRCRLTCARALLA